MLVLHQMHISGNCYKVRLLARQLGIPIALKDYGLHDGSTRTPEYTAKNPNGRVPMLELEDGRFLPESGAILWYLAEGTRFIPTDKWERAQMLNWMFFEQYSHEPYIAVARFWLAYKPKDELTAKAHLVPEWHTKGNAALGVMETHLKTHDWFAGNACSIADIALYGYTHCAADGGFDLARYPAVSRWLDRVAGQPGHVPMAERW
ncbi:MAG: glutathione S-transferase family protein [Proteobacteria bacterium]|nr:glutathione S-transferase family protein [Pseudomonadota bacterium]